MPKSDDERLYNAVVGGDVAVFREIISRRPELLNDDLPLGATWLHMAAQGGAVGMLAAVAGMGVAVEARDDDQQTPLHYAAKNGRAAAAQWLMDEGAAVDAEDEVGRTPLIFAVFGAHADAVRVLLDRGADPTLAHRGPSRHSALTLAQKSGDQQLITLLRAGAEKKKQSSD